MSKFILFYWSKGAEMRVKILNLLHKCNKKNEPCYESFLAEKLGLSHVAIKKHLDLMLEEGFIRALNPEGKPVYLEITAKGIEVLEEFRKK